MKKEKFFVKNCSEMNVKVTIVYYYGKEEKKNEYSQKNLCGKKT